MRFSSATDGFRLAYDRYGSGPPVVLLHGWPGDRTDYRDLAPRLARFAEVVVPDLRGFGHSDKHLLELGESLYSGAGQARSVVGLIEELGLGPAVIAGYDVGSFVAQTVARTRPDLVRALVVSPPLPPVREERGVLTPDAAARVLVSIVSPPPELSEEKAHPPGSPPPSARTCGISGRTGRGQPTRSTRLTSNSSWRRLCSTRCFHGVRWDGITRRRQSGFRLCCRDARSRRDRIVAHDRPPAGVRPDFPQRMVRSPR